MQEYFLKGSVAAMCVVSSLSAQACGFTPGAGLETLFSLNDPLDILILSVLAGVVGAFFPAVGKGGGMNGRLSG